MKEREKRERGCNSAGYNSANLVRIVPKSHLPFLSYFYLGAFYQAHTILKNLGKKLLLALQQWKMFKIALT